MKKLIIILLLLTSCVRTDVPNPFEKTVNTGEWELIGHKDGCKLYRLRQRFYNSPDIYNADVYWSVCDTGHGVSTSVSTVN